MTQREVKALMEKGAYRVEKNGCFCLVWSTGHFAVSWHDVHLISGVYPSIPAKSWDRLNLPYMRIPFIRGPYSIAWSSDARIWVESDWLVGDDLNRAYQDALTAWVARGAI